MELVILKSHMVAATSSTDDTGKPFCSVSAKYSQKYHSHTISIKMDSVQSRAVEIWIVVHDLLYCILRTNICYFGSDLYLLMNRSCNIGESCVCAR